MAFLSRVVWSEGMHLAQHHFQAQGRYFEDLTTFALSGLHFKPYGLLACELDAEALANGTIALTHARGVMPDGLPFQFPEDPPPAPLAIPDLFSPTQDSHRVLLAISPHRSGQANCALEPGAADGSARFLTRTATMPDEVTGVDVKPVTIAQKNFRLLLEGQDAGDMVVLPIARVRRDGSGHFVYDPDYVPPCLQVGASRALIELLARLVEKLDARADALRAERSAHGGGADYASREIASFWLSHAIHSSAAPLRHHLATRAAHPEEVFQELSRLAGALCTFSLTSHPRDLPSYDHDDATACFLALERHIREHLDIIFPTNSLTIPLAQTDPFLFAGRIADRRAFGRAHWFLGVRSSAGQAEVLARVPRVVKVCSAKHIARLVKEAFPGLPLPPASCHLPSRAPRIGTTYFSIGLTGPCWASIVDSAEVGVYVPASIPDAELEVAIVLEGEG